MSDIPNVFTPEWIDEPGNVSIHVDCAPEGLKPCPFCGSLALVVSNTHTPYFTVYCDECGAEKPGATFGRPPFKTRRTARRNYEAAFVHAILCWNSRTEGRAA